MRKATNIAINKTFLLYLSLPSQWLAISQYSSVYQPNGQVLLLHREEGIELV